VLQNPHLDHRKPGKKTRAEYKQISAAPFPVTIRSTGERVVFRPMASAVREPPARRALTGANPVSVVTVCLFSLLGFYRTALRQPIPKNTLNRQLYFIFSGDRMIGSVM